MKKTSVVKKGKRKSAQKSNVKNASTVQKSGSISDKIKNIPAKWTIIPLHQRILIVFTIILLFIGVSGIFTSSDDNDVNEADIIDSEDTAVNSSDSDAELLKNFDVKKAVITQKKQTQTTQGWLKISLVPWENNADVDQNWWSQTAHATWQFLLKKLENLDEKQFQQIIDEKAFRIADSLMKIKTKEETQEFLTDYFYAQEGFWSYESSAELSPTKISDNLGGSNLGLCAFALSVFSRLGILAEPAAYQTETSTFYTVLLPEYKQVVNFGGVPKNLTLMPVQLGNFWCEILSDTLDLKKNTLEKIKILHLLESKKQTNEIISKLYRLYLLASQQAAIQTEKTQYYEEAQKYQKLKDALGLSSSDDIYAAGVDSFKRGLLDDSWRQFKKLLQLDRDYQPESGESVYYYQSLIAAEKYEKTSTVNAKEYYDIVMKLDVVNEKHRPILLQAASIFKQRNESTFALAILNELEKRGFADFEIYLSRSELFYQLGEKFLSAANLRSAITVKPELKEPRLLLIKRLLELKLYKAACDFCTESANSFAELTIGFKIAGFIAADYLADVSLAQQFFQKFLEYQPDDVETQAKISELQN